MKYYRIACSLVGAVLLSAGVSEAQTNAPSATITNPPPKWVSTAALGLTLTRGNSDTTTLSASATTERKWNIGNLTNANDLTLGIDGLYATQKTMTESKSTETADLLHGFVQDNRLFSDRFYGFFRLEGLHDGIADIQYRLTLAPGVGYYFIKEKTLDLSAEVGPGWIDEKLGEHYLNYATLRAGEKLHWKISDHSRFWETAEYLPQVDRFNDYIINFEAGIEADLNKKKNLSLRCVLADSYNNTPAPDRLKNDLKLITAIAYKF
jgi:putative salt-induced outer membrane protein YdiY